MTTNRIISEDFEYFSVKLEGYDVNLELMIEANLGFAERNRLMKEVINNYIFAMKSQQLISEEDNVMIIDEDDWNILQEHDTMLQATERKIVIGFSGFDLLRTKYQDPQNDKSMQLEKLNKEIQNKTYDKVNHSLSMIKNRVSFIKPDENDPPKLTRGASKIQQKKGNMTLDRKTLAEGNSEEIISYKNIQSSEYFPKTGELFINPEVPNVLSAHMLTNLRSNCGTLSFCYDSEKHKGPMIQGQTPPCLLPPNCFKVSKTYAFPERVTMHGQVIETDGRVKITDKEILEAYEGVLKDVLISLAKAYFTGIGQLGMQLPIRIFEPISGLERICDTMSGYPIWIDKANNEKNMLERVKQVLCGFIVGMTGNSSIRKPFHPLLGETFSMTFNNGTTIFMEHICYDPPLTYFQMIKPGSFRMYGRYQHGGDMNSNSAVINYIGPTNIEFQDKTVCTIYWPLFTIHGLIHGERYSTFDGRAGLIYPAHKIKAQIDMQKPLKKENNKSPKYDYQTYKKRKDLVSGKIYDYNPEKSKKVNADFKNARECFEDKDCVKALSYFTGSFFETLEFDGVEYVNIKTDIPVVGYYIEHALPSDCRFREDQIWNTYDDSISSAKWKMHNEAIQAADRKIREKYKKK